MLVASSDQGYHWESACHSGLVPGAVDPVTWFSLLIPVWSSSLASQEVPQGPCLYQPVFCLTLCQAFAAHNLQLGSARKPRVQALRPGCTGPDKARPVVGGASGPQMLHGL